MYKQFNQSMPSDSVKKNSELSVYEAGFAGATSGFITRFTCQPLDVLKIRFQLHVDPISRKSEVSKYTSILQAVHYICKDEGVTALWKGHVPAQYLSVIFGAVQFASYSRLTKLVESNRPYSNSLTEPVLHFATGSAAGLFAIVLSFPFDIIRTRLVAQGENKVYHGVWSAARQIWQKEGLHGYMRGLLPACIQTAPLAGLTFGFHNIFQLFWIKLIQKGNEKPDQKISTSGSLVTGSAAGLCGKIVVYPLDLVKKRLQIQGFDESALFLKKIPHCRGVIHCIIVTTKVEGFFGLFKGLSPSLIKAGITNAIYFTVYEKICQAMFYTKR